MLAITDRQVLLLFPTRPGTAKNELHCSGKQLFHEHFADLICGLSIVSSCHVQQITDTAQN